MICSWHIWVLWQPCKYLTQKTCDGKVIKIEKDDCSVIEEIILYPGVEEPCKCLCTKPRKGWQHIWASWGATTRFIYKLGDK